MSQLPTESVEMESAPAPMRWRWLLLALAVIAGIAALRLNRFDLYHQESPNLLLDSRQLALHGREALESVRDEGHPPGLALFLAPISLLFPYNVLACKLLVLATAVIMLAATFRIAERLGGPIAAWVALILVACHPQLLLLSTEVTEEVPTAACSMLVLACLVCENYSAWWRARGAAVGLVASLFLGTAGLALLATGAGYVLARPRQRWKGALALVMAGAVLAAWESRLDRSELRLGSFGSWDTWETVYLNRVPHSLLPTVPEFLWGTSDEAVPRLHERFRTQGNALLSAVSTPLAGSYPWYSSLFVEPLPSARFLQLFAWIMASAALGLAGWGAWKRRQNGGLLIGLYAVACGICILLWSPVLPQSVWPLIPLIWVCAAAGFDALTYRWYPMLRIAATGIAILLCISLTSWNVQNDLRLIRPSLSAQPKKSEMYSRLATAPFYYCDWHAAGEWIRNETPVEARLLSGHASTVWTAQRRQRTVDFRDCDARNLHRHIAELGATHLVVPFFQFGDGFPPYLKNDDPVYRYVNVYEHRGVRVFELQPNRTGLADKAQETWEATLNVVRDAAQNNPRRVDLQIRWAHQIVRTGNSFRAYKILYELATVGHGGVRMYRDIGRMLYGIRHYPDAGNWLERAAMLPEAGAQAPGLMTEAQAAFSQRDISSKSRTTLDEFLDRARARMANFDLRLAQGFVHDAIYLDAGCAEAQFLKGELMRLRGDFKGAAKHYRLAGGEFADSATRRLRLMNYEQHLMQPPPREDPTETTEAQYSDAGLEEEEVPRLAVEQEPVDKGVASSWLLLAELWREAGQPGRSLEVLEKAQPKFPENRRIRVELWKLNLFYGNAAPVPNLWDRYRLGDPTAQEQLQMQTRRVELMSPVVFE